MKKIITTLFVAASNTTIDATMSLMEKGMNTIQKGFFYNSKELVLEGIEVVDSANKIFETVDTKDFTKGNRADQVISNIHGNLAKDLKALRKSTESNKFGSAAEKYGKVVNDCIACHSVVRGW